MNPHGVHLARAQQLISLKKYDLAVRELRAALTQDPNSSTAQALLASCLLETGDAAEAETAVQTAIGIDPEWDYPYYVHARVAWTRKKYRAAAEAIESALRSRPHDAD